MNSSQQQFLNKGKKASVKNPNTEADPVPFALFWSEFLQSPTGDAWWRLEFFQSSKKRTILTNVCLFNGSHGFLRFFTRFSTQKTFLSQRDHSHTVPLAKAQLTRMPSQFLKNSSFKLFQSGKNYKLGSVKNSRGFVWTLQADFSKGYDIGFFKGVSDILQKVLSERQHYGSGIKEKDGKNIGALFKPEPGK